MVYRQVKAASKEIKFQGDRSNTSVSKSLQIFSEVTFVVYIDGIKAPVQNICFKQSLFHIFLFEENCAGFM